MWMQQQRGECGPDQCQCSLTRHVSNPSRGDQPQTGHPGRPCGIAAAEGSTFHNGLVTLSNYNFNVQSGARWKALESKGQRSVPNLDALDHRHPQIQPTTRFPHHFRWTTRSLPFILTPTIARRCPPRCLVCVRNPLSSVLRKLRPFCPPDDASSCTHRRQNQTHPA